MKKGDFLKKYITTHIQTIDVVECGVCGEIMVYEKDDEPLPLYHTLKRTIDDHLKSTHKEEIDE